MTCTRTQEFLAQQKITVATTVNARNTRISRKEALALLDGVDDLYAMKGKRVVHVKLSGRPGTDELLALILGPTGNLRAPAVRTGRTLLVGFDADTYTRVLRG